jgi:hypothetical protein
MPEHNSDEIVQIRPPGKARGRWRKVLLPLLAAASITAVAVVSLMLATPKNVRALPNPSRSPALPDLSQLPSQPTGTASAQPSTTPTPTRSPSAAIGPSPSARQSTPSKTLTPLPIPAAKTPRPSPSPIIRTYTEEAYNKNGVPTFSNYKNASGAGTVLAFAQTVQVACKIYAPSIPSASPAGYWYRIESAPWNGQYYAVANTFLNSDPPGGPYTHYYDSSVPDC